eukprot:TRINITY_DN121222_c0_g1_i1.p1 TRINITY_DN121222_c0_g1~~TRINITY_DN121222_c0_g1_i1.p1  ORF type:complete len:595 (+),score=135.74 TRINITY_DN121222_c0_g1_i1:63-1847(+)
MTAKQAGRTQSASGQEQTSKPSEEEEEEEKEKDEQEAAAETEVSEKPKGKKGKEKKKGKSLVGGAAELVPVLILGYFGYIAKSFYTNLYPTFPDFDANHNYLQKYGNKLEVGEQLHLKVFVKESRSQPVLPADSKPTWSYRFSYEDETFKPEFSTSDVNISQSALESGKNVWVVARLFRQGGEKFAEAYGKIIKYQPMKEIPTKYVMYSSQVCEDHLEKPYGSKKKPMTARGIPQMQIRLVYDRTLYPRPWMYHEYFPMMYVDEFWLTEDQLVKFNKTGAQSFQSEVHFSLMSAARWRFQRIMERNFEQNAKLWGEDSEEMSAMRDLFANTHPYLLIGTMVVSVLHIIFEYLALKSDVTFWQKTSAETLRKFVSLRAVAMEIVCNIILMIYLYDQDSNLLVLVLSLCQVGVDCWKLTRVVKVGMRLAFGFLPCPTFESKVPHSSAEDYDKLALFYLSILLTPVIIGYAGYSLVYECHKGWGSYVLHVMATMVYALGFALMTPQLFINYRMKSVANLPWRRFIYRAINTFIDDLFSFIIKMPTMHRMSCFRDDIVFLIYLYQRRLYPVDMNRNYDEDLGDEAEEGGEGIEDKKTK